MGTPVWQILAKLDRIHELQTQVSPRTSPKLFGLDTFDDEESIGSGEGDSSKDRSTSRPQVNRTISPSNAQVVAATADTAESMSVQRVPVNVYEAPGALVIVAPLPAVTADDVTVDLQHGSLRFHAALRSAAPRPYLVHEWEYGGYEGIVELPDGFGSSVEANLANGQLVIRVVRGPFVGPISMHPNSLKRLS